MSSTQDCRAVTERVTAFCSRCLPRQGAAVLVAISGGRDSVALLHALCSAAPALRLELYAAHVSHGLRSRESGHHEQRFVERLCAELKVPLLVRRIPPGTVEADARSARSGVEAAARRLRYRALADAAAECNARYIATGHHLDDQLETCLYRFLNGSGPGGLAGIPELAPLPYSNELRVLRPLLAVSRAEVNAYLTEVGLEYIEDESNRSCRFARNRVRSQLTPLLEREFPGYRGAVTAAALRHAELAAFLSGEAASRCPWYPADKDGTALRCDSAQFYALAPPLRREALLQAYNRLFPGGAPLPNRFIEATARSSRPRRNGTVLRGAGVHLWLSGESLFCTPDVVLNAKKGYVFVVLKDMSVPIGALGVLSLATASTEGRDAGIELVVDRTVVKEPLIVRSRRHGDTVQTVAGTKKIKNIFSEWGLNEEQKGLVPVLEDREGVLAVVGAPFGRPNLLSARAASSGAALGPAARAVRITFDGV